MVKNLEIGKDNDYVKMKKEHDALIAKITHEYEEKLKTLESAKRNQKDEMISQYESIIHKLKNDAEIKAREFNEEMSMKDEKFKNVKHELEDEIDKLKGQIKEYEGKLFIKINQVIFLHRLRS